MEVTAVLVKYAEYSASCAVIGRRKKFTKRKRTRFLQTIWSSFKCRGCVSPLRLLDQVLYYLYYSIPILQCAAQNGKLGDHNRATISLPTYWFNMGG